EFLTLRATAKYLHARASDLDAQRVDDWCLPDRPDRVLDDLVALHLDAVRRATADRLPELLELRVREQLLVELARVTLALRLDVLAHVRTSDLLDDRRLSPHEVDGHVEAEVERVRLELRLHDAVLVDELLREQVLPDRHRSLVAEVFVGERPVRVLQRDLRKL